MIIIINSKMIIKAIIMITTNSKMIIKAIMMMVAPLNESLALLSVLILDGRGRHRKTFPIFKLSRCLFTIMVNMVTMGTMDTMVTMENMAITVTNNPTHRLYDCDQHSTHVCSYKDLEM